MFSRSTSRRACRVRARALEKPASSSPRRATRGECEVHDSQTGAGGLGCLVLLAASAAGQGASLEATLAAIRRARETLDIWFCLDTLEYLRRGGRIGGAQAMVGTALKIKPILTFGDGDRPGGPCAHASPGARADGPSPR